MWSMNITQDTPEGFIRYEKGFMIYKKNLHHGGGDTQVCNVYTLGCVEKHFFPRINLKLPENCPWTWTTNTLKYQ